MSNLIKDVSVQSFTETLSTHKRNNTKKIANKTLGH